MKSNNSYIGTASKALTIPVEDISDMWEDGYDVSIESLEDLESQLCIEPKLFFMYEGIIREYFIGCDGSEHTVKILQGPAFLSPSFNNIFRVGEPPLISQSLTTLKGHIWDISLKPVETPPSAIIFRIGMKGLVEAVRIKVINEVRRHECTAKERYQLFIKDFPGAVNLISLKYIASYLNMSPETISRIRKKLSHR